MRCDARISDWRSLKPAGSPPRAVPRIGYTEPSRPASSRGGTVLALDKMIYISVDLALLAEVPPAVNQIETHPFRQQREAHENMASLGVVHEAWAPFAEAQNGIFENSALKAIAEKHGKTIGQVILRALIQQDVVVIPKTVHRERMEENFNVFDFELDAEDMAAFAGIEDPAFPRIFDHFDVSTVKWMLGELVKKTQLDGGTLY